MSNYSFEFYAINGLERTLIEAESIELIDKDGNMLELHPRKSDGDISIYSGGRLVIRPEAANCVRVKSES